MASGGLHSRPAGENTPSSLNDSHTAPTPYQPTMTTAFSVRNTSTLLLWGELGPRESMESGEACNQRLAAPRHWFGGGS